MGVKKVHLISAAFRMVRSGEGSKNLGMFGRVALIFLFISVVASCVLYPSAGYRFLFRYGIGPGLFFFILPRCLAEEWRKKNQEHDVLSQGRWKLIKRLSQLRQACIRGGQSVKKHSFENRKKPNRECSQRN